MTIHHGKVSQCNVDNVSKLSQIWWFDWYYHTIGCVNISISNLEWEAWLPDGYSYIFRSYVFGPSGLKAYMPSLRCKIWSLPFLGLRQGGGRGGAIWQPWWNAKYLIWCHLLIQGPLPHWSREQTSPACIERRPPSAKLLPQSWAWVTPRRRSLVNMGF